MARARRGRFIRPAPRTKLWIGAGIGTVTLVGNSRVLVSSLSVGALLLRPFTILRTRQLLHFFSDQTATPETPFGAFGSIIVSDQARAAGAGSVPAPSGVDGDPEADWFVWQALSDDFQFKTAVGFQSDSGVQYVIDSKAMRKVGQNDDLVTIGEMDSAVGGLLVVLGRRLIQLH